jgi:uncharacterized phage protein (TIGR02220 family)
MWTYLLLRAAHKPVRVTYRGKEQQLLRAQLLTSVRQVAKDCGVHRSSVERFLTKCVKNRDIQVEKARQYGTLVTICKYEDYQAPVKDHRDSTETVTETVPRQYRDTEQEPKKQRKKKTTLPSRLDEAREVLAFLNKMTGRKYRDVPTNLDLIAARLKEGATVAECKAVIAIQVREWKDDPKWSRYLRPATLFNATKFWQYHGKVGTF